MLGGEASDRQETLLLRSARALFAGLSILVPPFSLAGFSLVALLRRPRRLERGWLVLWSGVLLPPLFALLLRGEWLTAAETLLQLVLVAIASIVLAACRTAVARGLALALALLAIAALLQAHIANTTWRSYQPEAPNQVIALDFTGSITRVESYSSRRLWRVSEGSEAFELRFDARLAAGTPGWDWHRSHRDYELQPRVEAGREFTRIRTPVGDNPHLVRYANLGEAAGTQQVRLRVDIRHAAEATIERAGFLYLYGDRDNFLRRPIELTPHWKTHEIVWTIPEAFEGRRLSVVLNNLDGLEYDVGAVTLETHNDGQWIEASPLEPTGAAVWLDLPRHDTDLRATQLRFMPTSDWRSYSYVVSDPRLAETSTLRAVLLLERDLAVDLRWAQLKPLDNESIRVSAGAGSGRYGLWFEHPNLAGHTAAAGLLALLSVLQLGRSWGSVVGVLGIVAALFVLGMTGSRGATLAALVGLPWFAWLTWSSRRKLVVLITLVAATFALVISSKTDHAGQLQTLIAERDSIARTEIWHVAWRALLENPLRGIGGERDAFATYWQTNYEGEDDEIASHAHNLWLAFGSSYGVPGLLASLWLTAGLSYLAWRWGRWRALLLVAPIFMMQIFDYTIFYSGVLFPLILGLNALRTAEDGVEH